MPGGAQFRNSSKKDDENTISVVKYLYGGAILPVLDKKAAIGNLPKQQKIITEHTKVIKVISFGSLAYNTAFPGSDADIPII